MAQASAAANRILSFRVRDKEATKATLELQDTAGGVQIDLKNVWFKYPTRDIPIFTGLNLTVISLSPAQHMNDSVLTEIRLKKDNSLPLLVHQVCKAIEMRQRPQNNQNT